MLDLVLLRFVFLLLLLNPGWSYADPAGISNADLIRQMQQHQPQNHPGWQLEWNNQAPQQRQALDNFYQSLQNLQMQQSMERLRREQNIEQLRDMSPQQRLQRFHDFVQDRGVHTPYR